MSDKKKKIPVMTYVSKYGESVPLRFKISGSRTHRMGLSIELFDSDTGALYAALTDASKSGVVDKRAMIKNRAYVNVGEYPDLVEFLKRKQVMSESFESGYPLYYSGDTHWRLFEFNPKALSALDASGYDSYSKLYESGLNQYVQKMLSDQALEDMSNDVNDCYEDDDDDNTGFSYLDDDDDDIFDPITIYYPDL